MQFFIAEDNAVFCTEFGISFLRSFILQFEIHIYYTFSQKSLKCLATCLLFDCAIDDIQRMMFKY